jgi:hypothetical protein
MVKTAYAALPGCWGSHPHRTMLQAAPVHGIAVKGALDRGIRREVTDHDHEAVYPLLARINYYLVRWLRKKYRWLRRFRAALAALKRAAAQRPGVLCLVALGHRSLAARTRRAR